MFSNIGGKIKMLAKVLFWIGVIGSVIIGGIFLISPRGTATFNYSYGYSTQVSSVLAGIIFIFLGFLLSWISSMLLYGFGQLIENSDAIRENTSK